MKLLLLLLTLGLMITGCKDAVVENDEIVQVEVENEDGTTDVVTAVEPEDDEQEVIEEITTVFENDYYYVNSIDEVIMKDHEDLIIAENYKFIEVLPLDHVFITDENTIYIDTQENSIEINEYVLDLSDFEIIREVRYEYLADASSEFRYYNSDVVLLLELKKMNGKCTIKYFLTSTLELINPVYGDDSEWPCDPTYIDNFFETYQ